jgi:hypothetical protein
MQDQLGSSYQTDSLDWPAWARAWGRLVVIAFLNGVLHRAYEGPLGELRAHQLSSFMLPLARAWRIRRHGNSPELG